VRRLPRTRRIGVQTITDSRHAGQVVADPNSGWDVGPTYPEMNSAVLRNQTPRTTSADPPSDANVRRSLRSIAKRTLNPATMRYTIQTAPLTYAIRELQREQITCDLSIARADT
jgi:hypothetical protein